MGALGPIIVTVVIVLVISAVVGAVAQFMNKLQDAATVNRRSVLANPRQQNDPTAAAPSPARPGGQVDRDMDRFLAEIDRLRRKNNAAAEPSRPAVVQQPKPVEKPRQRVVADVVESRPAAFAVSAPAFPSAPSLSFPTSPPAPSSAGVTRLADLPVATIVPASPGMTTGAPATRVTAPARRPTVAPKTAFGKEFAALLGTGRGAAMAVVLQEVLGPPKSQRS